MSDYRWVENVITNKLSNRALVLVSRFARMIKQINGTVINLQDPMLASKVVLEAQLSNDARVKALFDDILVEFQILVESRDQPRYRGTLSTDSQTPESMISADTSKVRYYRGVPIDNTK